MSKLGKVLFGSLSAVLLIALPLAQAQNAPGPDSSVQEDHHGERIQGVFSQLNLTDDQKRQLEVNKQQQRARMQIARQTMKISREELQEELMKPDLDMTKINAVHSRIKSLLSRMEDDRLSSILTVRAILTPEQFLKFINLMHKHKTQQQ